MHDNARKVFDILGLEPEERFKYDVIIGEFFLMEDLTLFYVDRNNIAAALSIQVRHLLTHPEKIRKPRWRPKDRDCFWFVDKNGDVRNSKHIMSCTTDELLISLGNCYKYKDEITEDEITKWKKFYKATEIKWEVVN